MLGVEVAPQKNGENGSTEYGELIGDEPVAPFTGKTEGLWIKKIKLWFNQLEKPERIGRCFTEFPILKLIEVLR